MVTSYQLCPSEPVPQAGWCVEHRMVLQPHPWEHVWPLPGLSCPSMPSPGGVMPSSSLPAHISCLTWCCGCLPDPITSSGLWQDSAGGAVPCRPLQPWDIESFLQLLASPGCPPHIGVWPPGWAKCTLARQINIRLPGPAVSGVFLAQPLPASRAVVGGWHWESCRVGGGH